LVYLLQDQEYLASRQAIMRKSFHPSAARAARYHAPKSGQSLRKGAVIAALLGSLAGCAPPMDGQNPSFPFANSWQGTIRPSPRLLDESQWWRGFQDPTLDALVARALQGSPDLAAAQLRARAAYVETGAIRGLTNLSTEGSASAHGGRLRTTESTISGRLGLETIFDLGREREADRLGAAAEAAFADAESASAQLLLIGEIADTYLALRHSQQRLALAQSEIRRQRETLDIARALAADGVGTRIDSLRSEARLAALDADRRNLETTVAKTILRLTILMGDAPGAAPPEFLRALHARTNQPRARLAPDPALPADLIRNRPDLRMAEARYDAARAALGKSRAALYPSLSLSGTIEARALRFGPGRSSGVVTGFGPSLRLPSLPRRATLAAVDGASLRLDAAYQAWASAVLTALYEVEAALLDYGIAAQNEAAIERAVNLQSQAQRLLKDASREGTATLSELYALEADLAQSENALADARLSRALTFVDLNLRLGMGTQPQSRQAAAQN
jgi:outer membrane protein, multidrug efflux system